MLRESQIFGINGRFGAPEKWFSIDFTDFSLSLNYNADNSHLDFIMDLVLLSLEKYL